MNSQSHSDDMGGVVDLPSGLERPRRFVLYKIVYDVERTFVDQASCSKKLRCKHRIETHKF